MGDETQGGVLDADRIRSLEKRLDEAETQIVLLKRLLSNILLAVSEIVEDSEKALG